MGIFKSKTTEKETKSNIFFSLKLRFMHYISQIPSQMKDPTLTNSANKLNIAQIMKKHGSE